MSGSDTTDFAPRKMERGCSLGHIATNRIFDTFEVSGTPDKNRVLDVVSDLIDHVQAEAAYFRTQSIRSLNWEEAWRAINQIRRQPNGQKEGDHALVNRRSHLLISDIHASVF